MLFLNEMVLVVVVVVVVVVVKAAAAAAFWINGQELGAMPVREISLASSLLKTDLDHQ